MKINWLNKTIFGMFAATAVIFASCSDTNVAEETRNPENPAEAVTGGNPNLTTVQLAKFASSQDRVTSALQSRADENSPLTLMYEIGNLSTEGSIEGFVKETRDLSATCVYYDIANERYYVTYHMQGNNYNTDQTVETSGYVETFKLDEKGEPIMESIYMAADPEKVTFDFNHLLFDDLSLPTPNYYKGYDAGSKRIIAVGHLSEPTSTGKTQTKAIIAKLNLDETPSIDYKVVLTGEKYLDANDKSLGDIDAGDVNCVARRYNHYYLATRKGLALLDATGGENLFAPCKDLEGNTYFIKTPGSAKHICNTSTYSAFQLLYLTENTPTGFDYSTAISANIARFGTDQTSGRPCGYSGSNGYDIRDVSIFNISEWYDQTTPGVVSPVDGKNVVYSDGDGKLFACLGKGGLYYENNGNRGIMKFGENGNLPVNGVYADNSVEFDWAQFEYVYEEKGHNGYVYVTCGARLVILDRSTLEEVASWNIPTKDKDGEYLDDVAASANYVNVVKGEKVGDVYERIITVAFGQAGVKVFKFIPPVK